MFTILPQRRSIMCGATALHMKNGPLTWTAKFSSQSSPVRLVKGRARWAPKWPALLTTMSTCPKRSRACCITSAQSASLVTSPTTASPRRPACSAAAAVCCARSRSRSDTTTSAPSRVRQAQMPRPMPPPPPVTTATLSCNRMPPCATGGPAMSSARAPRGPGGGAGAPPVFGPSAAGLPNRIRGAMISPGNPSKLTPTEVRHE